MLRLEELISTVTIPPLIQKSEIISKTASMKTLKNILLIIGELAVILFLIVSVDYIIWIYAWLPFIIYNILFIRKIAEIPWIRRFLERI